MLSFYPFLLNHLEWKCSRSRPSLDNRFIWPKKESWKVAKLSSALMKALRLKRAKKKTNKKQPSLHNQPNKWTDIKMVPIVLQFIFSYIEIVNSAIPICQWCSRPGLFSRRAWLWEPLEVSEAQTQSSDETLRESAIEPNLRQQRQQLWKNSRI